MSQMNNEQNEKHSLPFFGIGKVLPYMKKYRGILLTMVSCGLLSTCVDLIIPQFQRYALNYFISEKTIDTLPIFLLLGAFGMVGMWLAVFGDVGVALLAVLNAMRILKK